MHMGISKVKESMIIYCYKYLLAQLGLTDIDYI